MINFNELKTTKDNLINYIKSLNIDIKTNSKSKRRLGCLIQKTTTYTQNIIQISSQLSNKRFIEVLSHEFAHFIYNIMTVNITSDTAKLSTIFNINDSDENLINIIREELINVTNYVDKNSSFDFLKDKKNKLKKEIKILEETIKLKYPNFIKSKPFYEFNKYIKKSEAGYLLKYDNIKLITPFLKREKILSINNIDKDFSNIPQEFRNYIKLKSYSKKQTNITNKINKLQKYYYNPNELFARFIEGIIIDKNLITKIANTTYKQFYYLLENNYYPYLKEYLNLINT